MDTVAPVLGVLQAGRVRMAISSAEVLPGKERGEFVARFVCCTYCGEGPAEAEGKEVRCDENDEDSDDNDCYLRVVSVDWPIC